MKRLHFISLALVPSLLTASSLAQTTTPRDPNSPANIGRTEVVAYLNHQAATETAARRAQIEAIRTRAQAEARQAGVRKTILGLIGSLPDRTPLNPRITGSTQADGFRIEKLLFESQPAFYVTALVYVPDRQPAARFPAIVLSPGHSPTGKAGDAYLASTFARNGFLVLSYDPIGQGERLQYPDPAKPGSSLAARPTGEHGEAGLQPTLIGDAVARYFVWDTMRAVDYLVSRPDVDARRIGAMGCSGGGAMTALEAALDPRIAATGVACYNTSFDALLSTIGPQDGEQSIPGFLAAGLDFPDWIELVAPRPYAEIATYSDMFAFSGARSTAIESRRFYSLFAPQALGTPSSRVLDEHPAAPALNLDTTNDIPLASPFQFITGPGGHGALNPILGNIVSFFLRNLQPAADPDHPILPPAPARGAAPLFAAAALQVTPSGQVATSFPHAATVFSLNLERASHALPARRASISLRLLITAIRQTTGASAQPTRALPASQTQTGQVEIPSTGDIKLRVSISAPTSKGRHPAVLFLVPEALDTDDDLSRANRAEAERLTAAGNVVLAMTPSPSPRGTDDVKAPILGIDYLLGLRAELVGRTLVGLRIDDTIHAVDFLAGRPDVDPARLSAVGAGHLGLVLLYAATLDPRLQHVTVSHVLESYRSLVEAPLPTGAPEDIVPGVLRRFDLPDLRAALGARLAERNPLPGTADLSQDSTPLATLEKH